MLNVDFPYDLVISPLTIYPNLNENMSQKAVYLSIHGNIIHTS